MYLLLKGYVLVFFLFTGFSAFSQQIHTTHFDPSGGVTYQMTDQKELRLEWSTGDRALFLLLDTKPNHALIDGMGVVKAGEETELFHDLEPQYAIWHGTRDLEKGNGWTVFFDRPDRRPFQIEKPLLQKNSFTLTTQGNRCIVTISSLQSESFSGTFNVIIYPGSSLVRMEAALETDEPDMAYLYSVGLQDISNGLKTVAWQSPEGGFQRIPRSANRARIHQTKFRTILAESDNGSIGLFPPPHQFLYPLDFADNYGYNWSGEDFLDIFKGFGFGLRQPPYGDERWVPWMNAPPGTMQKMGAFILIDDQPAEEVLEQIKAYTHADQFPKVDNYKTFTSHYHVEHTLNYLDAQKEQKTTEIPERMKNPDFVDVFKEMGVDMVHLAEFHVGKTPGLETEKRLSELKVMHQECERLSTDDFLLIPGEEPNVHLGGHWISLFPKPVQWVLNRPEKKPFMEQTDSGRVYHVGSKEDVLKLFEQENGLMWTAHPRIKGSKEFPDGYKNEQFYQSPHFLGAAWKAMPADLSNPYLGERVLNLQNDMANRGQKKHILGEVDVFEIHKGYELYGAMNMNYLKLDKIPAFEAGWQPVLDVLRSGNYFTTTGEVLIESFTVDGGEAGGTIRKKTNESAVDLKLRWTFPMSFIKIIMGDGKNVEEKIVSLHETTEFDRELFTIPVDLTGKTWLRVEAWDVAANGAFTQPVWIEQ